MSEILLKKEYSIEDDLVDVERDLFEALERCSLRTGEVRITVEVEDEKKGGI